MSAVGPNQQPNIRETIRTGRDQLNGAANNLPGGLTRTGVKGLIWGGSAAMQGASHAVEQTGNALDWLGRQLR